MKDFVHHEWDRSYEICSKWTIWCIVVNLFKNLYRTWFPQRRCTNSSKSIIYNSTLWDLKWKKSNHLENVVNNTHSHMHSFFCTRKWQKPYFIETFLLGHLLQFFVLIIFFFVFQLFDEHQWFNSQDGGQLSCQWSTEWSIQHRFHETVSRWVLRLLLVMNQKVLLLVSQLLLVVR